jgi:superfamily II DNA or RNA helicase
MAVRVLKSALTLKEKVDLERILTITKIIKYVPGAAHQPIAPSSVCILEKDEYYHVPYIIATRFLKIQPRTDYFNVDLVFRGTLRPQQIEAGREAIAQLEAHGTTTLALCTGFGKTVVAAALACHLRLLTLAFFHLGTINVQQLNTFRRDTNAVIWIVGEKPPPGFNVILCMRERLHYIPTEILLQVGTFIIDEAHLHCTFKNIQNLLQLTPRYIILQTATLEKPDGLHKIMHAMVGKHHVYRESTVPFSVVQVPIYSVYPVEYDKRNKLIWSATMRFTAEDEGRNNYAAQIAIKCVQEGHKPLILTHLVEHAYVMEKILQQLQQDVSVMCESKKNYKDANILVGSVSKIGTAFDAATLCVDYRGAPFDVLIIMGSFASETILVQCVGRVLRAEEATVYHLVNVNDKRYAKHWEFCRKWYLKKAKVITIMS